MLVQTLELRLPDAREAGGAERTGIEEAAHPAVTPVGVGLVGDGAHGGEDAAVVEVPLLDLVVVALDVRAETVEVLAEPRLDGLEPCSLASPARVSTPHSSSRSSSIASRLRASMYGAASSQSGASSGSSATSSIASPERVASSIQSLAASEHLVGPRGERVLELVVGQIALGLAVVSLGDEVEERLVLLVVRERLLDDLPADGAPSSIVVNEWPSRGRRPACA